MPAAGKKQTELDQPSCPICAVKPLPDGEALLAYNQHKRAHFDAMKTQEDVEDHEFKRCLWLGAGEEEARAEARRQVQGWRDRRDWRLRNEAQEEAAV